MWHCPCHPCTAKKVHISFGWGGSWPMLQFSCKSPGLCEAFFFCMTNFETSRVSFCTLWSTSCNQVSLKFSLAYDADFSTIIQILGNGFLVLLSQDLHQTVPDIVSGESKWEALGSGTVSPYHCCCVPQRSGQVSRDIILPTTSWRWSKPFSSEQSLSSVADVVLLLMQFMFVHLPKKWYWTICNCFHQMVPHQKWRITMKNPSLWLTWLCWSQAQSRTARRWSSRLEMHVRSGVFSKSWTMECPWTFWTKALQTAMSFSTCHWRRSWNASIQKGVCQYPQALWMTWFPRESRMQKRWCLSTLKQVLVLDSTYGQRNRPISGCESLQT